MLDGLTGQYYLRARFYSPVIGRFLQEDTYYGDGLNLYSYCHNNPVRYVDPSGNEACPKEALIHHRHQIPIRDGGVLDELQGPGHPKGNEHTKGSPSRHPGPSVFNQEAGGAKLRQDEIKQHWKEKGKRLVQTGEDEWTDFGPE